MLGKAIEHGKEHRRIYMKSKAFDATCRNHGSCNWCEGNRLYSSRKRVDASDDELDDWHSDEYGYDI